MQMAYILVRASRFPNKQLCSIQKDSPPAFPWHSRLSIEQGTIQQPTMTRLKRSLEDTDPSVNAAPAPKRASTGKAKENDPPSIPQKMKKTTARVPINACYSTELTSRARPPTKLRHLPKTQHPLQTGRSRMRTKRAGSTFATQTRLCAKTKILVYAGSRRMRTQRTDGP